MGAYRTALLALNTGASLKAYWPPDEQSGNTIADASGLSHPLTRIAGTFTGGAALVPTDPLSIAGDGTLYFTAAAHADFNMTAAITVLAVAAFTAGNPANTRTVLRKAAGATDWWIRQVAGGTVNLSIWTAGGQKQHSTAAITDGSTHHYAMTYDGSVCRFYLDGALAATSAADAGGINSTASAVGVGHNAGGTGTEQMVGSSAHIAVFNRQLSTPEIAGLYAARSSSAGGRQRKLLLGLP